MNTKYASLPVGLLVATLVACSFAPASAVAGDRDNNRPMAVTGSRKTTLPREAEVPWLAELGRRYDALPAVNELIPTQRQGNEIRLAVHSRGNGTNNSVIILLHGVLADHTVWRHLAGELGEQNDLWLIDMPGCGDSDKPKPSKIESDGYSPTAIGERVLQALAQRFADREAAGTMPTKVTFVAHSLGGMTAIRMFGDPELRERYASVLQRIDRLVLLAPVDVAVHSEMPIFMQVINIKNWQAAIAKPLGVIRNASRTSTVTGVQNPATAVQETALRMEQILSQADRRHAAQAMLTQAVPWRVKEHRPDWAAIQRLTAQYVNLDVPLLIVWGECDEVVPASMGHKLKDEIRGAQLVRLENCAHSIASEMPLECAQLIRTFQATTEVANVVPMRGSKYFAATNGKSTGLAKVQSLETSSK